MNFPATAIATLFGIGRAPVAPGTWASLVALPLAWGIMAIGGVTLLGLWAFLAAAFGIWACDIYVRESGKSDPSECVIDELAGQWIACLAAPLSLAGYALAFILFRLFDIWKPWPISAAERAKGGLGVMLDDLVAGVFAAIIVAAVRATGLI
jgi:phosphatidylglycerophosphatase A